MKPSRLATYSFLCIQLAALPLAGAEWPEFRGPTGQGVAVVRGAPTTWSETENVTWKTALPGLGWSSPVIRDGKVWLTTATEDGRSLRALGLDVVTGELLHDVEVFRLESGPGIHKKNSHASPTPILEDDRVYVHFGRSGTAALDASGRVLWRNQEHRFSHVHGNGGSPVMWGDLLIFSADGSDKQTVVALDKNTGKTVWVNDRGGRMSFSTPLAFEHEGRAQVVSTGGDHAASYDPKTGDELWRITYDGFSLVPRPVYGHGLVYVTSGFYNPILFAVRPGGEGDVTDSHVVWQVSRGVPLTPSPLLVGDELYMVSDRSIATCLDAKTGRQLWQARVDGASSASPTYAAGNVYFLNEAGQMTIFEAGPERKEIARNQLDGRTLASPAFVDGAMFLRTEQALYRIEP